MNFGVVPCMAVCTAVVAFTRPLLQKLPGSWGIAACLVFFALTWGIPKAVPLPYLAWLGFPGPGFVSGSTIPLVPRLSLCTLPACCPGSTDIQPLEAPAWAYANPIPALAVLGRHTVLPAPSASHSQRAQDRLFRTIALEPRCNTSRQLRHNANAVLEIFLMQKGSLLI